MQILIGVSFLLLSSRLDKILEEGCVKTLTVVFSSVVFLCATQDIAVDGWALTLLEKQFVQYASTAQTVGLNIGYFSSFTVFLALNSAEFCNKYLRLVSAEEPMITLSGLLYYYGFVCLLITVLLMFVKEKESKTTLCLRESYRSILNIVSLKPMKKLIFVLLVSKIGYIASESIAPLKLLEKGFKKEDLAVAVLIDFPFQILFGILAVKWASKTQPLRPWLMAAYARLALACVTIYLVSQVDRVTTFNYLAVILAAVATSFTSTVMFVSSGAFFSSICDDTVGGTYMTLLNTVSNLGGTWPQYFILDSVDHLTVKKCTTKTMDCADGEFLTVVDGFYVISALTLCIAFVLFVYIRKIVNGLERISVDKWKHRSE